MDVSKPLWVIFQLGCIPLELYRKLSIQPRYQSRIQYAQINIYFLRLYGHSDRLQQQFRPEYIQSKETLSRYFDSPSQSLENHEDTVMSICYRVSDHCPQINTVSR